MSRASNDQQLFADLTPLKTQSYNDPVSPLGDPLHDLGKRRARHLATSLIILLCLTSWSACDSDDPMTGSGVSLESLESCLDTWDEHYLRRVPAGSARWLPAFKESEECPTGLSWSLESGPESASPALIQEESGLTRFTPLQAGIYVFGVVRGGESISNEQLSVDVVDALERPFHNYNYYPSSRAGISVGEEVWIAGVNTPQIARLSASNGAARDPILVGGWPVGIALAQPLGVALVTQKADDTLGVIDLETAQLVDTIWVGDEPSEVIWDEARERAYVSLSGSGQVAVVDLRSRSLLTTLNAVFDAQAMALHPDNNTLVVASRRSGQSQQFPYSNREISEERDVAIIDLEALEVSGHILEVSSTIHALRFDEEGALWVSATSNNTEGSLNDPEARSFVHEVFTLEIEAGEARRGVEVDLSRQESSGGSTGVTGGFTWCGGSLWVTAEGANAALALDSALAEVRRVTVEGRPRVALCVNDTPWIVSSNRQRVAILSGDSANVTELGINDQRPDSLIDGFELFHGQGEGVGDNRSCSACHADGLSDGVVWNAGPVENRQVTRPLRWLEGTELIGWDGYVGSVRISGYVGGSTINKRGDTESSDAMGAYLASLMPAPAATSLTRRDGALSVEAQRGAELFKGTAACASCHAGAVTTSRAVLPEGLTPGKTDIPTLIDVARVGSWYKTGEMPTLEATLDDTAEKFNVTLAEDERAALLRYLRELTARDFFTLKADFGPDDRAVGVDAALALTFSFPILDSDENLARIRLLDASGMSVPVEITARGRHVIVTPSSALEPASEYRLELGEGLLSDDGREHVEEGRSRSLTTAEPKTLTMEGSYTFTAQLPFFDPQAGTFDPERSLPSVMQIEATSSASGAQWAIDYGQDMVYQDTVVLSGDRLYTKHLPISAGPSFLNGQPLNDAEVIDEDGDGFIDRIEGTFTMTGPGLDYEGRAFKIEAASAVGECVEGVEGPSPPTVTQEGGEVIIDWGEGLSLSFFVTSPDAQLPLGPIPVMGGETYWSLAPIEFPNGFAGPLTYGVVPEAAMDATTTHDGPEGGAPLESGKCYKFGVLLDFVYSTRTVQWP